MKEKCDQFLPSLPAKSSPQGGFDFRWVALQFMQVFNGHPLAIAFQHFGRDVAKEMLRQDDRFDGG